MICRSRLVTASFRRGVALVCLGAICGPGFAADWKPAAGPLKTRWSGEVSPGNALPEYPRPQLVRPEWLNLNGLWDYAIRPAAEARPAGFDGQILVPFPIESALSGVLKRVPDDHRLWYERKAKLPAAWAGRRVLLHFGAADWETTVWVNGKEVGTHRGGYDPFTFDITNALQPEGEQVLAVAVADPTDAGTQPRGKQVRKPHGIWYTPTTGIWQTVWLEPVPQASIAGLKIVPDIDNNLVKVIVSGRGTADGQAVRLTVRDGQTPVAQVDGTVGKLVSLPIEKPKLWSPDEPFLYDLDAVLLSDGREIDKTASYFGMRKVSLGPDAGGITRILLNNKPLFLFGPLDQGFWPDGLYTAPTDQALRYDVQVTRQLGFNMARKHVKVEPARWYYWCDKLGLLVWQDMPNGDKHVASGKGEITRSPESAKQFETELKQLIDAHHNHPSIVMWVVFNEGWGQYDTTRVTKWVKEYDPTRLANCASGWNDFPVGDVHDIHRYPGPAGVDPEPTRAAVLGEFGGLGLPLEGHTWQAKENWGYRSFKTSAELTEAYLALIAALRPLVQNPGLSAAVYTQTTDVEIEVNGLMTYDRALIKMDAPRITAANRKLYLPPPRVKTLVPTSQEQGYEWRYTTQPPAKEWFRPDFDDSKWSLGPGGFGTKGTPGAAVRSEWKSPEIWLRRSVDLPAGALNDPHLRLHHDEDAEVYINGKLAARVSGYSTDYGLAPLSDAGRAALRSGRNVLAVYCKQTGGGQYIDVGIVDLIEQGR